MAKLYKGTTPTIKFTFRSIDPTDIVTGFLTIRQERCVVIEKAIDEGSIEENSYIWKLTQSDTLKLREGNATIYFNWVLRDGTRGVGRETTVQVVTSGKDEVI